MDNTEREKLADTLDAITQTSGNRMIKKIILITIILTLTACTSGLEPEDRPCPENIFTSKEHPGSSITTTICYKAP